MLVWHVNKELRAFCFVNATCMSSASCVIICLVDAGCMSSAWCVIFGFVGYDFWFYFGRVATWVALFSEFSLPGFWAALCAWVICFQVHFCSSILIWFLKLLRYLVSLYFIGSLFGLGDPGLLILVWVLSMAA